MFNTLRRRLIFYFVLAIAISLLLNAAVSTGLTQLYIRNEAVNELRRQADILAAEAQSGRLPKTRFITVTEKILRAKLFYVSLNGAPVPKHDRQVLRNFPDAAADVLDWGLMTQGKQQVVEGYNTGKPDPVILVAQPLFDARHRLLGAIILTRPLKPYQQAWLTIAGRLLLAGAASLFISVVLAFYLSERLSRPLKRIRDAARQMAGGDYSQKVQVSSGDEVGELAKTFNHMAEQVKEADELQRHFVMSVTHELKTPLTSIQGFTEALLDNAIPSVQQRQKSLGIIFRESKRLERLINDLLDLAKLDAKQFSLSKNYVDLDQLLAGFCQIYEAKTKIKGVSFLANIEKAGAAFTDGQRLLQIIGNLLDNALKFTPKGADISIAGYRENGTLLVDVSDTGPGISQNELPRIFERFFSGGQNGNRGSGLGLAIAAELTNALEGTLSVESRPETTTFHLRLPVSERQLSLNRTSDQEINT